MEEKNLIPRKMTFKLNSGMEAQKDSFVEVSRELEGLLLRTLPTKEEVIVQYSAIRNIEIKGQLEEKKSSVGVFFLLVIIFLISRVLWLIVYGCYRSMTKGDRSDPIFNILYEDEYGKKQIIVLNVYSRSESTRPFIESIKDMVTVN